MIRACADEIEARGSVTPDAIDAITDRGLFRLNIPARSYGEQAHPLVVFHVIEALAHADASTAWVVMIASEVSLLAAWLPNAVLSQMIGGEEPGGPRCRIVGSSRVMTTAQSDVSGYRLSGRLNFVSGVEHATHIVATFVDFDDQVRFALLPQRAGKVINTWDAMGLQGTGSHDWELKDAFVQQGHTWAALDQPAADGPQWRVPDRSLVAWIANAGHAVGTAQGALDDLADALHPRPRQATVRPCGTASRFALSLPEPRLRLQRLEHSCRRRGREPGRRWKRAHPMRVSWRGAGWPTYTRCTQAPTRSSACFAPAARTPRAGAGPWSGAGAICRRLANMAPRWSGTLMQERVQCSDCLPRRAR